MGDDKPPMPPLPQTKEIAAPTQESILLAEFRVGFRQLNARFDETDEKVDVCIKGLRSVTNEVEQLKKDSNEFREWKGEIAERMKTHSIRAVTTSQLDQEQNAQLAQALGALAEERAKRETLEKTAATKDDVAKVLAENQAQTKELTLQTQMMRDILGNPLVKKVGYSAAGLLLLAMGVIGVALERKMAAMQAPSTPQVIYQLPPVVVVGDGGAR